VNPSGQESGVSGTASGVENTGHDVQPDVSLQAPVQKASNLSSAAVRDLPGAHPLEVKQQDPARQTEPVYIISGLTAIQSWPCPVPLEARPDQITPLEFPVYVSQSEALSWASLTEKGLKQSLRDFVREKDLSLLTVAGSGIDGLNRITDADLSLDLSRDVHGTVSGFNFRSSLLSVRAPVRKAE
jgi:hypothetical protein